MIKVMLQMSLTYLKYKYQAGGNKTDKNLNKTNLCQKYERQSQQDPSQHIAIDYY